MDMRAHPYVIDDEPDWQSTKAELWGLLGALVALKVIFAIAILIMGTDGLRDATSMAGQVAMHWTLITIGLIAAPIVLLRKTITAPDDSSSGELKGR